MVGGSRRTGQSKRALREHAQRLRERLSGNGGPAMPAGYSATAGLGFDDVELESKLTWIWGSPRSGSTWLLQLLAHPLDPDPETQLGFRLPKGSGPNTFDAIPVDESFLSNHLAPALADPRRVGEEWVPGTLNNYLSANKPTYAFSQEYEPVWRPEARRFGLVRIAGTIQRARNAGIDLPGLPHVVIKETNGTHAADLLMSLLPGSRMLLLIRDGRDVVDSLVAAYQPGAFLANNQGQSFGTPEKRATRVRWAAELWACNTDTALRAMEAHPDELCRVLRYEDLLANTTAELAGLYEWMGIRRDPEWIAETAWTRSFQAIPDRDKGPLTRNRAARPGMWRDNLSDEEQAVVAEVFGSRLARFGYED